MVNNLDVVKKNELIILKEIKRICEKYNLRYNLAYGTLLGAIRHKGFIPWDDDIDIEMPYDDYKKFIKICNFELDDRFFLQNNDTDLNYYYPFIKIRMNNTTFVTWNEKYHHIHHGFWVDIFPVIKEPKVKSLFKKLVHFCSCLQMYDFVEGLYKSKIYEVSIEKKKFLKILNKIPISIRRFIRTVLLCIVIRKPKKNKGIVSLVNDTTIESIPNNSCFDTINTDFEDDVFAIPQNYHEYLTMIYGDYMKLPPENERITHCPICVDEKNNYDYFM